MQEKIEEFCEEIKMDYFLFLYNYKKIGYLEFPFCCKVSADIISSFMQLNFGDKFQYKCTTRGMVPHGWTEYQYEDERFIIDFTRFQFELNDLEKKEWRERKMSDSKIKERLKNFNPVQKDAEYDGLEKIVLPKRQKCIGLKSNLKVKFTKKSFFEYLKKIIDHVYLNTDYNLDNNYLSVNELSPILDRQ